MGSGLPHRLAPTGAAWLRDQDETLWWTFLEESGTLFVQFNAVRGDASNVISEIRERAQADDVERVVIDLRHNSGGDNTTLGLLERTLRDPAIDRPGKLFAVIGRVTFSAAANFATDLEGATSVTFAGEDMGGSPNLFGDTRPVHPAGQRPDPAHGRPLLGAEHAGRRPHHDRAGDPRRADGGRLLRRARSGPRGDRRGVVEFGLTTCPG